jgi:ribose 1,5-bisphosphokinase
LFLKNKFFFRDKDKSMGKLFYVIGASGVGKDSVMEYAREKINGASPVIFAHRYITRPANAGGENHVSLSKSEFELMERSGLFAFHWNSHDHSYGIGIEIYMWLKHGFNVVVNGSREYLSQAQQKSKNLEVVLITAKPETIKERLLKRGRENQEEIDQRLLRNKKFDGELGEKISLSNDGNIEEAGNKFIRIVTGNQANKTFS